MKWPNHEMGGIGQHYYQLACRYTHIYTYILRSLEGEGWDRRWVPRFCRVRISTNSTSSTFFQTVVNIANIEEGKGEGGGWLRNHAALLRTPFAYLLWCLGLYY